jgi:hypothetical protein
VRQPILLLVNDEEAVLDALKGDLARRFGVDYRILAERSPAAGLVTARGGVGGGRPAGRRAADGGDDRG